ncbi:hypothetical protein E2C01_023153 [Portunus trituberculatus]|uniref:Uncharacterized protein n=1 Tax=Portunus trituberculatus TaxID=210409 RepID=A0A5B7E797_PORTR|nr:hypothetical protein [Portunus trituberculatus]
MLTYIFISLSFTATRARLNSHYMHVVKRRSNDCNSKLRRGPTLLQGRGRTNSQLSPARRHLRRGGNYLAEAWPRSDG